MIQSEFGELQIGPLESAMINLVIEGVITIGAWFMLLLVSTNLVGFLVRGFVQNPKLEEFISNNDLIARELKKSERMTNLIAISLIAISIGAIYYFWNIGVVIATLMLMISRLPDLIWEIRHGQKFQSSDMGRPKFAPLATLLSWASLPVLWYALYRM